MDGRSWTRVVTAWQDPTGGHRGGVLDAAWQAYLFPQSERVAALGRVGVAFLTIAWWAVGMHGHPAQAGGVPVSLIAGLVVAGCLAYMVAVFSSPRVLERLPIFGLAVDMLLVLTWLQVMGVRAAGPFLALTVLGSASGATRAPLWAGAVAAGLYAVMAVAFGGADGPPLAGYTLIVGLGMAVFSSGVHHDRLASLRDPLTGLYSRRWGLYRVQSLISPSSFPFCVGVLDLDGFKEINDVYGHLVGDQVLATLAGLMQVNLRGGDAVVRLGGDEFMLILPGTDVGGARVVAERVRVLLADARLTAGPDGRSVTATASIGLVQAAPGSTVHGLIERADACLYEAKRQRNTIVSEAV